MDCTHEHTARARGLQGLKELLIALLLFPTLIGTVAYYAWVDSIPLCQRCGHRVKGGPLTR